MATATLTPPPMARVQPALAPHRWTLDEYRKLNATGLFSDLRTMLLDGVLYVMALPSPAHNTAADLTAAFLRTAFPVGHHVRSGTAFDIGRRTDPGPDIAVVPGSIRDYAARNPSSAVLIVEVSDSSLFMDTTTKAEVYATAAVPEYWVIDLESRRLIVFRDPEPLPAGLGATAYRTRLTFTETDTVAPLAAPQHTIAVSDLLP